MYDPDDDEPGAAAERLIEACYAADGMLWSSPMYQGTISGAFKNALDWLHVLGAREPPFLHDKVVGLISAAGGTQGLQAINTMEFATRALRAWDVPYVVPVAAATRVFDQDGQVQDAAVEAQLKTLGWRSRARRRTVRRGQSGASRRANATRQPNASPRPRKEALSVGELTPYDLLL